MEKFRKEHIQAALDNCRHIVKRAQGKPASCNIEQDACQKVELYITTYIIPRLESALRPKRSTETQIVIDRLSR